MKNLQFIFLRVDSYTKKPNLNSQMLNMDNGYVKTTSKVILQTWIIEKEYFHGILVFKCFFLNWFKIECYIYLPFYFCSTLSISSLYLTPSIPTFLFYNFKFYILSFFLLFASSSFLRFLFFPSRKLSVILSHLQKIVSYFITFV